MAERGDVHYLDLCNDAGQVVKITRDGWDTIPNAPVLFVRPDESRPLPAPERGGSVSDLRDLLPLDDGQWLLALAWLLGTLREDGGHCAMVLQGAGDTAKSTIAEMLVSVLDPREELLIEMRPQAADILIAAHNRWCLAFDEVKPLTPDKLAILKGIITGTGYTARKLYEDGKTYSFSVRRPLLLTGHTNLLDDKPFLSRTLPIFRNSRVSPEKNRESMVAKADCASARPRILGALLDMVVNGLKEPNSGIPVSRKPRMMDAAVWIGRCLTGSGMNTLDFLDALESAHAQASAPTRSVSAGVPVAPKVIESKEWSMLPALTAIAKEGFHGSASALCDLLNAHPAANGDAPDWSKSAPSLGLQFTNRTEQLQALGILVDRSQRNGSERLLKLSYSSHSAAIGQPTTHATVVEVTNPLSETVATGRLLERIERDFQSTAVQYPKLSKVYMCEKAEYELWGPLASDFAQKLKCPVQAGPRLTLATVEAMTALEDFMSNEKASISETATSLTKLQLVPAEKLPDLQS